MKKDKKKTVASCFLSLFLVVFFVVPEIAASDSMVENEVFCHYCRMLKSKFGHTWIIIEYEDGSKSETCSIHCASVDLALNIDKMPISIMVGDYNTRRPIDSEKAFWVIGGTKPGVMTTRAKWAFEKKSVADHFIKEFGGEIVSFDEAIKAAFEDMYQDIKMIRKKRRLMRKNSDKENK